MYRSSTRLLIILCVLFAVSVPAFAWDENGHKITAYIAWQRMTPEVREKAIKLLLSTPEDAQLSTFYSGYGSRSQEMRQRDFFMLAATWPDIIRDKSFTTRFSKYAHGDWHYADVFWQEEDGKAVPVTDAAPSGHALEKIAEFEKLMRSSATDAEKGFAVTWLVHLIGDMHQPLHASSLVSKYNAKGDQGGNLFFLTPKGTPRDKQENLHWFWDSIVVRYEPNTKDQCDDDYLVPIADTIMNLYPYDKLKSRLDDGKYESWEKESYAISTTEVYKGVTFGKLPSDEYKKKAFQISQERLALAGYRIADLFNTVLTTPAAAESK